MDSLERTRNAMDVIDAIIEVDEYEIIDTPRPEVSVILGRLEYRGDLIDVFNAAIEKINELLYGVDPSED